MKDRKKTISRRTFVSAAASTTIAFTIVPSIVFGKDAPSNKLNIASIGAGGQAASDIRNLEHENIIALADVDMARAKSTMGRLKNAKVYRDFRVMLDEMDKDIDAVVVATPDHTHYAAAMASIERGKHVFCQKPLAHSIYEVRKLTEAARKQNVKTQMGNQGHSSEYIRLCKEWIEDGAIGDVTKVEAWSNRPMGGYAFPSSIPRPKDTPPVPDTLDWDLWLGPAQYRPYHPIYAPIFWRAWLDFGTGALGDMGCHILDPAFWALNLGSPISVEAQTTYNPDMAFWSSMLDGTKRWKDEIHVYMDEMRKETYPAASRITYEFGARGSKPPVTLTWYDGGMLPPRPEAYDSTKGIGGNGAFIIGDKGLIMHGSHGANGARIHPVPMWDQYRQNLPPKTIKRVRGHHQDWIDACKGGDPASSNFDYGGPLTEMVLLGVIAARLRDKKLLWDSENMKFTNSDEANALVKPNYRKGWKL